MPRFRYSAYSASGSLEKGELQADTDLLALDQLSARGLIPVLLEEGTQSLPWWQRELSISGKVEARPAALEQFFKTLSGLLNVEFGLLRALSFCADNSKDKAMSQALDRVQSDVREGSTLGAAMAQANGYFPERLITMVEIGEASDQLGPVAARIAQTLGQEATQRRELRSALIYPAILVIMSVLVLLLLVFFLTPTLAPVFASAGAELPGVLKFMELLRAFLISHWLVLCVSVISFWAMKWLFNSAISQVLDNLSISMPIIGNFKRQSETLKALQTLLLMLSSGAPLNQAIKTVCSTTRAPRYQKLFIVAQERVVAGGKLSEVLSTSPLIDPLAAAMLEAGEESNRLVGVLEETVKDLTARTNLTLSQSVKLITPIFTLVIGLTVGGIILSTISAIMSLNDVAF